MFTRFFIYRPIFASVLSIIITLAGVAVWGFDILPVAQYPDITPPTVEVSAVYPGANADVVCNTVAAPIEQQVNGVEGMMYMVSQCTNDGSYALTITFAPGVNLDIAQVLVQNRVALAQPVLPDLVQRFGVAVKKKASSVLMIVNFFMKDVNQPSAGATGQQSDPSRALQAGKEKTDEEKSLHVSNEVTIHIKDELARIPGVGDISYLGRRDYSIRVWLDPQKMWAKGLSTDDVIREIQQQNIPVAGGQTGQPPVPPGQVSQLPITMLGRLSDPSQFDDIILKTNANGSAIVRLRDVAHTMLGAQSYDQICTMDRKPCVALCVYQLPGSNALRVSKNVQAKMLELKQRFPDWLDYDIVYDTTPFIIESIHEVYQTLFEAILLVAAVMLLFLQNWRSALIPLVAVPVAVIGTFASMWALSFSLNNLTLFGLVLAIGIVVDDAIVVVEAVEHHIEEGLSPRDAAILAMDQVSGPVIAVGLVLAAVFVPCAFISGIIGQFFRQFALTIAVSTLISAFNSLTLSPALAALLLRPRVRGTYESMPRFLFVLMGAYPGFLVGKAWIAPIVMRYLGVSDSGPIAEHAPSFIGLGLGIAIGLAVTTIGGWVFVRGLNVLLAKFFHLFNVFFDFVTDFYTWTVGLLLKISLVVLVVYGGLLFLTYWSFTNTPTGFIPSQDKGFLLVNVQLPDGASAERTQQVIRAIETLAKDTKGVKHTVAVSGQSILLNANAPNFGALYVMLDNFEHRLNPELSSSRLAAKLEKLFQTQVSDGLINVFEAPPIEGLGTAGGFKIMIEDRGDLGRETLQEVTDGIVTNTDKRSRDLQGLYTSFRAKTPWMFIDIDRMQAKAMRVSIGEVLNSLQVYQASLYVNDINKFGRTWQVNVQGDQKYRSDVEGLKQFKFRNEDGAMVPLATFTTMRETKGPSMIVRYNMYSAAPINGNPAAGVSSGTALASMEKLVDSELGSSMKYEWTELAFLQLQTGNTALLAFALAVVLVFLVLAAQYESTTLPLAVILVVPMCLLFSVAGVVMARMDINIFTQVGFVVLVGLACKNAILIVEFAKAQSEAGVPRFEATLAACKLRLRPIIMTSFAFILGVVPLIISHGAGAEMRYMLGTAVFSGMLGVTLFGIFLTPVFFYTIQWLKDMRSRPDDRDGEITDHDTV